MIAGYITAGISRHRSGGGSGPALVASTGANDNGGGGTPITSPAIDTTGANFIALCLSEWTPGSVPAISDSYGNSWTLLATLGAHGNVLIAYAWNATVGAGHTFTVENVGSNGIGFSVMAFSGVKSSSDPLVAGTSLQNNTNPGPTNQPGSVSVASNDLIITCNGAYQGFSTPGTFTVDSGFTIPDSLGLGSGSASVSEAAAYRNSAGSAVNPTWTSTGAGSSAVQCGAIAAFAHA